ncbi:MAG: Holliday junction branch migration protein RuvA [Thiomargarita sp.]|nr:Holliday junction branch migration protein RuvA [Thiomargarita sp.]
MISRLRGLLIEKKPPLLVIDVQGVGYEVFAPMSSFYNLPEVNTEISLLTHLSIREDAHVLYGFLKESERSLFRELIRISGVGPKLALSILSSMELTTFVQYIQNNDIARLKRIPGVGKKTAERLIIEMRDSLEKQHITASPPTPLTQNIITPVDDAISALIALGYKPADASRWVHGVAEEGLTSEVLIRRALQSAL